MMPSRTKCNTNKGLTSKTSVRNEVGETHYERLLFKEEMWLGERKEEKKKKREEGGGLERGRGEVFKGGGLAAANFFLLLRREAPLCAT